MSLDFLDKLPAPIRIIIVLMTLLAGMVMFVFWMMYQIPKNIMSKE